MRRLSVVIIICPLLILAVTSTVGAVYDVTDYGAMGDGSTLDSPAINAAIEAADANGGGTVYLPPGTYKSGSIRLKSNITLNLDANATILATDTLDYDVKDDNPWVIYAGFGNSYWKCSVIWAKFEENIAITGSGTVYGAGNLSNSSCADGEGNKTVGLRSCNGVLIKDVTFHHCGHYALKLTGCNDVTVENIKVDTNRDGITFDNCYDVNITDCYVSAHQDDAITLKSTYAMGYKRDCNNVNISGCTVMGYELGTYLDGTKVPAGPFVGRIKFGTESVGGFRNVTVTNCTFEYCMGFMIASVDGGIMENINISNITMNTLLWPPIFIRLGDRNGASPGDPPPGIVRNININNLTARVLFSRSMSSGICGIPGYYVEDVNLSNIDVTYQGGGTAADAELVLPENNGGYPDPDMFGDITPSYGFYLRHADGIEFHDCNFSFATNDERPAFVLIDVNGFELDNVDAQRYYTSGDHIKFDEVDNINIHDCPDFPLTTASYDDMRSSKYKITSGEPFTVSISALAGSTGISTTDMIMDSNYFDTEYSWLNAGTAKDIEFSDIQLYNLGEHRLEIDVCDINIGICPVGDFDLSGRTDSNDYAIFAADWLKEGQIVLQNDPVAWWKFEEGSGSLANDSSVNSNTGTLHNMDSSDWVSGYDGGALDFDGGDDYISVNDSDSVSVGGGDFTICAWIYPHSISGWRGIVTKVKDTQDKEYAFSLVDDEGDGALGLDVERGANDGLEFTAPIVTTYEWQHVMVVFDSAVLDVAFYHNFDPYPVVSPPDREIDALPRYFDDNLCIGRRGGIYNDHYFDGIIDDVRIYNYKVLLDVLPTDLTLDYIIDFNDLDIFTDNWLTGEVLDI